MIAGVSNALFLLKRVLAWALVGVVLAAVFLTYLQPALAFDLATRMWSCFG